MKISLDTWIVSDTHFGHDNIIRYCDRPENHNDLMLANWNSVVADDDVVLHLGDLVWRRSLAHYVRVLNGRKHLIKGNHDHEKTWWYEEQGFKVMPRKVFFNWNGKIVLFTHRPEAEFTDWDINIHGHIHNSGHRDDEPVISGKDYRNVSVEVIDYTPVRLREILGA